MRSCFSPSVAYFMKDKSKSIWSSIGIKSGAVGADPNPPSENFVVVKFVVFGPGCNRPQCLPVLLARRH